MSLPAVLQLGSTTKQVASVWQWVESRIHLGNNPLCSSLEESDNQIHHEVDPTGRYEDHQ
jgi:hypothetical protein